MVFNMPFTSAGNGLLKKNIMANTVKQLFPLYNGKACDGEKKLSQLPTVRLLRLTSNQIERLCGKRKLKNSYKRPRKRIIQIQDSDSDGENIFEPADPKSPTDKLSFSSLNTEKQNLNDKLNSKDSVVKKPAIALWDSSNLLKSVTAKSNLSLNLPQQKSGINFEKSFGNAYSKVLLEERSNFGVGNLPVRDSCKRPSPKKCKLKEMSSSNSKSSPTKSKLRSSRNISASTSNSSNTLSTSTSNTNKVNSSSHCMKCQENILTEKSNLCNLIESRDQRNIVDNLPLSSLNNYKAIYNSITDVACKLQKYKIEMDQELENEIRKLKEKYEKKIGLTNNYIKVFNETQIELHREIKMMDLDGPELVRDEVLNQTSLLRRKICFAFDGLISRNLLSKFESFEGVKSSFLDDSQDATSDDNFHGFTSPDRRSTFLFQEKEISVDSLEADKLNPSVQQTNFVKNGINKCQSNTQSEHVISLVARDDSSSLNNLLPKKALENVPPSNNNNGIRLLSSKTDKIPISSSKADEISIPSSKADEIPISSSKADKIPITSSKAYEIPISSSKTDKISISSSKVGKISISSPEANQVSISSSKAEKILESMPIIISCESISKRRSSDTRPVVSANVKLSRNISVVAEKTSTQCKRTIKPTSNTKNNDALSSLQSLAERPSLDVRHVSTMDHPLTRQYSRKRLPPLEVMPKIRPIAAANVAYFGQNSNSLLDQNDSSSNYVEQPVLSTSVSASLIPLPNSVPSINQPLSSPNLSNTVSSMSAINNAYNDHSHNLHNHLNIQTTFQSSLPYSIPPRPQNSLPSSLNCPDNTQVRVPIMQSPNPRLPLARNVPPRHSPTSLIHYRPTSSTSTNIAPPSTLQSMLFGGQASHLSGKPPPYHSTITPTTIGTVPPNQQRLHRLAVSNVQSSHLRQQSPHMLNNVPNQMVQCSFPGQQNSIFVPQSGSSRLSVQVHYNTPGFSLQTSQQPHVHQNIDPSLANQNNYSVPPISFPNQNQVLMQNIPTVVNPSEGVVLDCFICGLPGTIKCCGQFVYCSVKCKEDDRLRHNDECIAFI